MSDESPQDATIREAAETCGIRELVPEPGPIPPEIPPAIRAAFDPFIKALDQPLPQLPKSRRIDAAVESLERCDWCELPKKFVIPEMRTQARLRLASIGIDHMLEDVPVRPNNMCPTHWQRFIDLREGGWKTLGIEKPRDRNVHLNGMPIGWRKLP